ncbi:MAG: phosphoglucosamine mutase [Caldimicrobium sp.]
MRELFGTDGIRGEANIYPLTPEIALKVGRAVGYLFKNKNNHTHKVIIGKDTRLSCYLFENALTAGLCSVGVNVYLIGPIPTPGVAFLTEDMRADAGIMISASHNPYYDNGIKIFDSKGFKLSEELEQEIEKLVFDSSFENIRAQKEKIGRVYRIKDAIGRYAVHLKSVVPQEINFEGVKVGIDCANGACYLVAPLVFEELGATVKSLACEPNGININKNCGALFPENIKRLLLQEKLDIAFALDGDGDRIAVIDDKGNLWDGDDLLALFVNYFKEKNLLKNPIIIGTLMTNQGLEEFLRNKEITLYRTAVGDKYVVSAMRQFNALLGGETSGHIIFLDKSSTGDGLLCALRLLSILKEKDKALSEFYPPFEKYPQILINVKIKEKKPLKEIEGLENKMKIAQEKLKGKGRIIIRPSGTEFKYRVMVEAKNRELAEEIAKDLAEYIQKELS